MAKQWMYDSLWKGTEVQTLGELRAITAQAWWEWARIYKYNNIPS